MGTVRWEYSTRPVYGWGSIGERQLATAGWLAVMPVFEPHWQICMAGGLSTGLLITISEDSAFQQKLLSVEAKRLDLECDRWKLSLIVGT